MQNKLYLVLAALFAVLLLPIDRAEADYRFGADEEIRHIQDVPLKGAENEDLYLGYMTRTQNFLLGLSVEDRGYVLGVKGQSKRYYPMPEGEDLARFQNAGTLPDPLPPYKIRLLRLPRGLLAVVGARPRRAVLGYRRVAQAQAKGPAR